jgi:hypothetical protein
VYLPTMLLCRDIDISDETGLIQTQYFHV